MSHIRQQHMKIEQFAEEDWQKYRAVRLRALADTPDAFARTLAEEKAFSEEIWRRRLSSGAVTFVAVLEGRDVGLVTGAERRDRRGTAGLFGMWVAPEVRQRGVGLALVRHVVDWAHTAGFEQLVLDVADKNHAAITLYDRAGFHPTGNSGALPPPREHVSEHERALPLSQRIS
jgi:GNAT superfamily N-acetyltransferase